jgi:MFS family permease
VIVLSCIATMVMFAETMLIPAIPDLIADIVKEQFQREKMSIGQDILTSIFASGAVIGLTVGGIIILNYGWMTTFFTINPGRNKIISSYSIFYPY